MYFLEVESLKRVVHVPTSWFKDPDILNERKSVSWDKGRGHGTVSLMFLGQCNTILIFIVTFVLLDKEEKETF